MNIALMRNAYMATTIPTCSACSLLFISSFFLLANTFGGGGGGDDDDKDDASLTTVSRAAALVLVLVPPFPSSLSFFPVVVVFVRNAGNTSDVKYTPRGTKKYPMTLYQQ
jgi:hypothetical protein